MQNEYEIRSSNVSLAPWLVWLAPVTLAAFYLGYYFAVTYGLLR
jgi:hypothetical protein